jgi:hypothetical protein
MATQGVACEAGTATIFISYRRDDAAGHARLLFKELSDWFGANKVFFDQEKLRAGDPFPDRLDQAVRAARVTLAVIAPQWLSILNARASKMPDRVDVVRQELKLALQMKAVDSGRLVIPVLMGEAAMFSPADLHESVRADLEALCGLDAQSLGGKQQRWELEVQALCQLVSEQAMLRPTPASDEAARLSAAATQIAKILDNNPELASLKEHWGAEPLTGRGQGDVADLVTRLAQSVQNSLDAWRRSRMSDEAAAELRRKCRGLLSTLYCLAMDGSSLRELAASAAVGRSVPAKSAATVGFAYAVAHGRNASMAPNKASGVDFVSQGTVDLGHADPGIGNDRRAHVHQAFWAEVFNNPLRSYPGGQGEPLSDEPMEELRDRIWARARRENIAHLVTEVATANGARSSNLNQITSELGVVGLARTGKAGNLTLLPEGRFNALIVDCLDQIESIR